MAVVKARTEDFEKVGDFLRLRVGLIFGRGNEPKNAQGMLRHPAPSGAQIAKLYFPPVSGDLLGEGVVYRCPVSVESALYGELLLKLPAGNTNKTRERIMFGRFGEDKPFEFNEKSSYLPLRISRPEEGNFNPLYIRHRREEDDEYFVLMVRWDGESIAVRVFTRSIEEVPLHLVK